MGKPWERYKVDTLELFDKRLRSTAARVLWRAYGPTHFGGPTGRWLSPVTPQHHFTVQVLTSTSLPLPAFLGARQVVPFCCRYIYSN